MKSKNRMSHAGKLISFHWEVPSRFHLCMGIYVSALIWSVGVTTNEYFTAYLRLLRKVFSRVLKPWQMKGTESRNEASFFKIVLTKLYHQQFIYAFGFNVLDVICFPLATKFENCILDNNPAKTFSLPDSHIRPVILISSLLKYPDFFSTYLIYINVAKVGFLRFLRLFHTILQLKLRWPSG